MLCRKLAGKAGGNAAPRRPLAPVRVPFQVKLLHGKLGAGLAISPHLTGQLQGAEGAQAQRLSWRGKDKAPPSPVSPPRSSDAQLQPSKGELHNGRTRCWYGTRYTICAETGNKERLDIDNV